MIYGFMKFHGFHGNPLCNFKEWECMYKNSYISAATHSRLLNLASH